MAGLCIHVIWCQPSVQMGLDPIYRRCIPFHRWVRRPPSANMRLNSHFFGGWPSARLRIPLTTKTWIFPILTMGGILPPLCKAPTFESPHVLNGQSSICRQYQITNPPIASDTLVTGMGWAAAQRATNQEQWAPLLVRNMGCSSSRRMSLFRSTHPKSQ